MISTVTFFMGKIPSFGFFFTGPLQNLPDQFLGKQFLFHGLRGDGVIGGAHELADDKKEAIKMLPKGFTDSENE